jgi:hypothetical protein
MTKRIETGKEIKGEAMPSPKNAATNKITRERAMSEYKRQVAEEHQSANEKAARLEMIQARRPNRKAEMDRVKADRMNARRTLTFKLATDTFEKQCLRREIATALEDMKAKEDKQRMTINKVNVL